MNDNLTEQELIRRVGLEFSVSPTEIIGRSRNKGIVKARQVAMYLLRQTKPITLEAIGKLTGGRSPATVTYAYQKIAKQLVNDWKLMKKITEIMSPDGSE